MTINGDLNLSINNALLRIANGLMLNGTIHLSGVSALLLSEGVQTIGTSSAGTITFEGPYTSDRFLGFMGKGTLTLDTGITVRGGRGTIGGPSFLVGGTSTLINQGTIIADISGQTITIQPTGTFTNTGSLQANGGGNIAVFKIQLNIGFIQAGAGSLITVIGTFTNAATGQVRIDVGGRLPSQFGRIVVSGAASLDGILTIELVAGFQPVLGDAFDVLLFASLSGDFITFNGPVLPNGLKLVRKYFITKLTLAVENGP